ncbi:hypothetical protein [Brevibacillus sp. NRS-1366]|uniref:hypothetical protein n=1 Tax=Brevibacillus sp. NRS-1366 TaxID=3233899 RepID=UPI003D1FE379
MPVYKLDPEWVESYLAEQEQKLACEVTPDEKDAIMSRIREMTLSIMYKQARRFLVYFESDEAQVEDEKKTRLM